MQSVYDINHLAREALTRWLKPPEVYFILQNCEEHQLTHQVPQRPPNGSLYLFNKRVVKYFRKDGHSWRRRRDQRTIAEAHERLKVGNVEALNCYYAHGEENPYFQRRSFWILDPQYEHIVLVHYRDIREGTQSNGRTPQSSPIPSSHLSPSPNSLVTHQADSSVVINGSFYTESSPSSVEISSTEVIRYHGMDPLGVVERANEVSPSEHDALQRLRHQLSLNDDEVKESNAFYFENEDSNDLEDALRIYNPTGQTSNGSDNILYQQHSDDWIPYHEHPEGVAGMLKDMLDGPSNFQTVETQAQVSEWEAQDSSFLMPQKVNSLEFTAYSPAVNSHGINPNSYSLLFDQDDLGVPVEDNISLTVAPKQKFTIREVSPEWCYASEGAKIVIVGSFLCNPLESNWACMFGDTEVPVEIIQEGVIRCHAPTHLQGKVTLRITSGNRESCSEARDFEYRDKPSECTHDYPPEREPVKSSDELLLLVRFVQMLLSDLPKVVGPESKVNISAKSRFAEELWNQIMDALLDGTSTLSSTLDQLLQELLKDKLANWLSSRVQNNGQRSCSLSKKEQGLIHMVAGLGFEWALQPILNAGVSIDFRDINGCTALHWAAKYGRERMVAALIASGASAGAVTDPNSQDPNGKTPASIAATCGHAGLAGYLSEVALTSHLTSLVLKENELSKGSAAVEAERKVNSFSNTISFTHEDRVFAAVRNTAQAAARIQSAFRAHSFRRRQQKESENVIAGDSGDEYSIFANDIHGLSAAAKLTFGSAREHSTAALSIQKKYRGWKGRRDFLTLRQKVVKIQAHVRGHQVRKNYKVCWAVGILEKVVLRWRRRGVGLRGFKQDAESIDQSEDEDILKMFRKQKVDAAIDEAVSRVLSMVESPDARQQYHRLLEKYRQAKAQLQNPEPVTAPSAQHDNSSYRGFS